ncbi:hypothetical protein CYMTET_9380 [Cymbomonas tetramitiformis]|uniref:Uncharacterized protein n=1 Tax=Cymbomonas tetramitiformis TaxID=36881 RepID=A0AAE0GR82_9CHLO|nr:hypothetical protein CYMTET_9380 [Cymbomonas tetramitiformis]
MPEVVSVPGTLGEALALLASADKKFEKADSLGHKKLATVCSMFRDVILSQPRAHGSSAVGAAFQTPDDFSTDHVDAFSGSEDDEHDSQNPPGYWDESDFEDENDGSQNPPGYWDESDCSEEECFSESAVSLPHLGVPQSSAPLEPGVDSFEEPADGSPLGEDDISNSYE